MILTHLESVDFIFFGCNKHLFGGQRRAPALNPFRGFFPQMSFWCAIVLIQMHSTVPVSCRCMQIATAAKWNKGNRSIFM